jgi:D-arginine dehydrogenase
VTVLEAEESPGYHSTGRSATMLHYALGNRVVRELTLASRPTFDQPPADFTEIPLCRAMPVLVFANEEELAALDDLGEAIAPFAVLDRVGPKEMTRLCPVLKVGKGGAVSGIVDRSGLRLDPHALVQAYLRKLRHSGGNLVHSARIRSISRSARRWQARSEDGRIFSAGILVNAAGAWCDSVARLAGVAPLDLEPKRRTIITFDAPKGADLSQWPFAKTVGEQLYFAPESGRIFASPMDEVPTDPCDAQPDDYEVALAAHRVEERTTMKVGRIAHKWAGLRTFAPDRMPVAGFAADAEGFFWLAGQGGFGIQTSPMMAAAAASLICGTPWPLGAVAPGDLSPGRFSPACVHSPSPIR